MKKILILVLVLVTVGLFLWMATDLAFADSVPMKERTVHVLPGTHTFPAPGPGEHLTVIVDRPRVAKKDASAQIQVIQAPTTNVVMMAQDSVSLRGGLITGITFPGHTKSSFTGGLIGEIGPSDAVWRIQGAFRAGNCKGNGEKGVALDSELSAMGTITKNFRAGIGADLLYCSNIYDAPKEKASERIVGGSLRLELVQDRFSVTGSIGVGAATTPIPGDRETRAVLFGGLSASYMWGN